MEDYVSFEQAKALKKLGFDWKCFSYYRPTGDIDFCYYNFEDCIQRADYNNERYQPSSFYNIEASAPSLSQAQKWLRKEKGIIVQSSFIQACDESIVFESGMCVNTTRYIIPPASKKYEEALRKAIDCALKYIKENGL